MEKIYKIQKPLGENSPELYNRAMAKLGNAEFQKLQEKANAEYISWDEFRKKSWAPSESEEYWTLIKLFRRANLKKVPIYDKDGGQYGYSTARHSQFLHEVDLEFGGNLLGIRDFSEGERVQVVRRNLIEESIASSKLEGANTSREAARKMLREGRLPRDKSERMIVNNHAAMSWIETKGKNQKLSIGMLLDLHRMVVDGTLQNEALEGKFRNTLNDRGKRLVIKPWADETISYVTPDREFVDSQLPNLIAFANDHDGSAFIHPLIKAIMLHFWIGLLHPFEDGNGRLARILFYWYMLRREYWAFSYLSLSEYLLKSPKPYSLAYINSEQDDYDLNYFIQYNVEKLQLARQKLQEFLKEQIHENKQRMKVAQGGHGLSDRQIRLLQQLNIGEISHANISQQQINNPELSYLTAIKDLRSLVEKGLLRKVKNGRNVIYLPTDKVQTLFC
jgi:Fic family protein